jgi:hypothetical protein
MALTAAQRNAQRSLVGLVRAGGAVVSRRNGLSIWRQKGSEEWQVGVEEIAKHLEVLGVPYSMTSVVRPARGARHSLLGSEIRVAWHELDTIIRWVPSVQRLMGVVDGDSKETHVTQPTNKGRKNHNWPPGTIGSDGSLTVRCKNCGLGERIYQTKTFTRDLLDSQGNVLDLERMPDCPKAPSW